MDGVFDFLFHLIKYAFTIIYLLVCIYTNTITLLELEDSPAFPGVQRKAGVGIVPEQPRRPFPHQCKLSMP